MVLSPTISNGLVAATFAGKFSRRLLYAHGFPVEVVNSLYIKMYVTQFQHASTQHVEDIIKETKRFIKRALWLCENWIFHKTTEQGNIRC